VAASSNCDEACIVARRSLLKLSSPGRDINLFTDDDILSISKTELLATQNRAFKNEATANAETSIPSTPSYSSRVSFMAPLDILAKTTRNGEIGLTVDLEYRFSGHPTG